METPGGMETVKTAVPGSYQVLESVNAFCGVTLTLHQVPILGGDCPSEVNAFTVAAKVPVQPGDTSFRGN